MLPQAKTPSTLSQPDYQTIARAKLEQRRRDRTGTAKRRPFNGYPFEPHRFVTERLQATPWKRQSDILDAYRLSLLQQHEKRDYEAGRLSRAELQHWQPGQTIKTHIRVESGNGVGKTKLAAWFVLHFISSFTPAVCYSFAPSFNQINMLLWEEIRKDHQGNGLPGRVLRAKPHWYIRNKHFAIGRATNDDNGRGMERVQGQHNEYLIFVLDEAEGVAGFVFDAIQRMTTGGVYIVLMIANPKDRSSRFHREAERPYVENFRISCLEHPNVVEGREIIPGAVTRDWVRNQIEAHCLTVEHHDPDKLTFELDWQPGSIYQPDGECLMSVFGMAPQESSDRTFIPIGRYEAALKRKPGDDPTDTAVLGIDAARFGSDFGTVYVRHLGRIYQAKQLFHQDTLIYFSETRKILEGLHSKGVRKVQIRVDGTGGFGAGLIDQLNADIDLKKRFTEFKVIEVQFGASPSKDGQKKYYDLVTEMYAEAGETLKGVKLDKPPIELEADLTEREYRPVNKHGRTVNKLEDKETYRKRRRRSPDDGDGLVLCAAPEHIFKHLEAKRYGGFIPA